MATTPESVCDDLIRGLIPALRAAISDPAYAQRAADMAIPVSNVYLGMTRELIRAGALFDGAVAALCTIAHTYASQEKANDAEPDHSAAESHQGALFDAEGQPTAEALGNRVNPELG